MTEVTVALLHPGEMGAAIGAVLVANGHRVRWASAGRSTQSATRAAAAGLEDAGTLENLLASADGVVSVCPPHAALEVALSVAGFTGWYLDANAISPERAGEVAAVIESEGGHFVDGGLVGSPPGGSERTRLYLSGTEADALGALFAGDGVAVNVISERPGAASALKMAYAAWTKGTAALILGIRAVARANGVDADLLEEWTHSSPELVVRSQRAAHSAATKGWRWVGEMEEIAATFANAGLPSGFHEAAAQLYARCGRDERAVVGEQTLEDVLASIAAAS